MRYRPGSLRVRPIGLDETIEHQESLMRERKCKVIGRLKVMKFSLNSIPAESFNEDNFYVRTKRPDGTPLDIELDFGKFGCPVATDALQEYLLLPGSLVIPPIPDPTFTPPDPIYEYRDEAWALANREEAAQLRAAARAGYEKNSLTDPTASYRDPIDGGNTGVILNWKERKAPFIEQPFWDICWGSIKLKNGRKALVFQDLRWILLEVTGKDRSELAKGLPPLSMAPKDDRFPTFLYVPSESPGEPNRGYIVYGKYAVEPIHSGPPTAVERKQEEEALASV